MCEEKVGMENDFVVGVTGQDATASAEETAGLRCAAGESKGFGEEREIFAVGACLDDRVASFEDCFPFPTL